MVPPDPPKVVSIVVNGLMDTDNKNITISIDKSLLLFCAVYHINKNHVIPHPVIAAILDVISVEYFKTLKNNNNMPVKFS